MGDNQVPHKEAGREAVGSGTGTPNPINRVEVDVAPAHSKRSPAFQFYPRDFLASSKVDDMSMTERGAYVTLLCKCWLDNGLPTDMRRLAAMVRMKPSQFERIWQGPLGECFKERSGKFHNDRLDAERKKQTENRKRQSDNANARWHGSGNATAMPPHTSGNARAHAPAADADSKQQIPIVSSEERLDVAFAAFRDAYPAARRKGGYLVQQQFLVAVDAAGGSARLMRALANHRASEQWSNPAHVPGMDVWLNEERWRQELPVAGSTVAVKTNEPEWVRRAREAKAKAAAQ